MKDDNEVTLELVAGIVKQWTKGEISAWVAMQSLKEVLKREGYLDS